MRKPNLAELAHIAEISAAIAVIISLIYVGQQVRENTAAIRSSTMQAVANSSDLALQYQAADEELSRIRKIGDSDISALTESEASRYWTINRAIWIRMQNIYAQQQLGVLDDSFWYTYSNIICEIYVLPGVRAIWPSHSIVLDPDFVEFVESCSNQARIAALPEKVRTLLTAKTVTQCEAGFHGCRTSHINLRGIIATSESINPTATGSQGLGVNKLPAESG